MVMMHMLYCLNNIIGGGMSSRLFQNIREEQVWFILYIPFHILQRLRMFLFMLLQTRQVNMVLECIGSEQKSDYTWNNRK